jgi:hypothetical protein
VYRWLRSGKLPGSRMSPKSWRISDHDVRSFMTKQNVSELLFEDYLNLHQLGVPDHEPLIPGKNKRIDYRLPFENQVLWFEVKEFAEDTNCLDRLAETHGLIQNPHIGIRQKIDKASEKFREYPGDCCSLVLYNSTLNLNRICTPATVLAAMLGNVWIDNSDTWVLKGGGRLQPQLNTRISAVIALDSFRSVRKNFVSRSPKNNGVRIGVFLAQKPTTFLTVSLRRTNEERFGYSSTKTYTLRKDFLRTFSLARSMSAGAL